MQATFGSLSSTIMISLMQNAKKRIVYLAPSISKVLAEAIVTKKPSVLDKNKSKENDESMRKKDIRDWRIS